MTNRHVLVVDDDEDMLTLLQFFLKNEDYEVTTAEDGLIALDKLTHFTPALILLDLMMPRMDGYAFVAELLERGLRPAIPIIVLSADVNARKRVHQMGIEDFLTKPYDLTILLKLIERFVVPPPLPS